MESIVNNRAGNMNPTVPSIMIGEVINTNDPQQMGRIQAHIPTLHGDKNLSTILQQFSWVSYGSPFGGIDSTSYRGVPKPDESFPDIGQKTTGPVAYGMWAIPKVGAHVLICSIDNDPNRLFWFGCVYPNSTPHTLPHGRYSVRAGSGSPDGPLSTTEDKIYPLYDNLSLAFTNRDNFEWRSRGADYQVAGATKIRVDDQSEKTKILSEVHDDGQEELKEDDGNVVGGDYEYRQGYAQSRFDPTKITDEEDHIKRDIQTDKNLESQVLSFTTPGFHSISMDDRPENNRTRFRTSSGHQILMDDTNERIYVSTNEGRNWIEMDSNGHVYIYSEESISLRAEGDINLTAEKSVRIKGNEGVHIQTPKELRIHAQEDIHIRGEMNMFTHITQETHLHSEQDLYVLCNTDTHLHTDNLRILTDTNMHSEVGNDFTILATNIKVDDEGTQWLLKDLEVTGVAKVTGAAQVGSLNSGGAISAVGDVVSSKQSLDALNGHTHQYNPGPSPPAPTQPFGQGGSAAPTATPSPQDVASNTVDASNTELAFWTNIIPQHEPWARTFIKEHEKNVDHTPEFEYKDSNVNKQMKKVKDTDRKRGKLWHR